MCDGLNMVLFDSMVISLGGIASQGPLSLHTRKRHDIHVHARLQDSLSNSASEMYI